jgi:hypothetical protein
MSVPLVWRHKFPSAVLIIVTLAIVSIMVLNIKLGNFDLIVLIIAIFSAALYGGYRRNAISIACIGAIIGGQLYSLVFHDYFLLLSNSTILRHYPENRMFILCW